MTFSRAPSVKAAIAVLLLVELLSSLEASMIYTALPTIAREYGGMANVGWLISAFMLVQTATVALGARLGDIYGRRRVLLVVLVLSSLGSLVSLVSTDLAVIIAGRAIQGVSAALLPLCFGIAREIVAPRHLPVIIGLLAGIYSASGAIGFLLGGVLTESFGWHSIFVVTLLLPILIFPLVVAFVPRIAAANVPRSLDLAGALLMVAGITALLLGVTYASSWPWQATLAAIAIAAGILFAWARHELSIALPLIDVRLLRDRGVAMANLGFVCLGLGAMQLPLVIMAMIQQPAWTGIGLGVGAAMAGVLKLPSNFISALAGPFSGWLGAKSSPRTAAIVGSALCAAGWTALYLTHSELWIVVVLSVVIGAGLAMTLAAMPSVVLAVAPLDRSSEVTGMLSVSRTLGVTFGAQAVTVMLSLSTIAGPGGERLPDADAYRWVFAALTGWACMGLLVSMAIPLGRRAAGSEAIAPAE